MCAESPAVWLRSGQKRVTRRGSGGDAARSASCADHIGASTALHPLACGRPRQHIAFRTCSNATTPDGRSYSPVLTTSPVGAAWTGTARGDGPSGREARNRLGSSLAGLLTAVSVSRDLGLGWRCDVGSADTRRRLEGAHCPCLSEDVRP